MSRYRASNRDRYATLTISLLLVGAVITAVLVLAHKIAAHVQHAVQQAPAQQDTSSPVHLHDMLTIVGALAQSPLVWGLALCGLGALIINNGLRRE